MQLNKNIKKIMAIALSLSLCFSLLSYTNMNADETVVTLNRDEVGQMAVDHSTMIVGLENTQSDLIRQFSSLKNRMAGLNNMYSNLGTYKLLYQQYLAMAAIPYYYDYLAKAIVPATIAEAATMVDGDFDNNETYILEEETALNAAFSQPTTMTAESYGAYLALKMQFDLVGITNPTAVTKEDEYNTFVYPIKVAPRALQNGVVGLTIGIQDASAGISNGAVALFDTILMLEGYEALQLGSYTMAKNDLDSASKRYNIGQISEIDYQISINKERIAQLNYDKMVRDVENLKMNYNVMLGQDVTTRIELSTESIVEPVEFELGTMASYIEKGLKERNEFKTQVNDYSFATLEFDLIDDYFRSSSNKYKAAAAELRNSELKQKQLLTKINQEIRKAYLNVLEKEENLVHKGKQREDSLRQYSDFELNVELGFVTKSTLGGLGIMVTQANNDYETALREYLTAISSLEGASSTGPAYTEGGMSFE